MTISAAAKFSGLGRSTLYVLIHEGKLTPVRIGRRVLLPRAQLIDLLAEGIPDDP